ncbi:hypothetical protein LCGC14_2947060, partial [marine sediment metagenome]
FLGFGRTPQDVSDGTRKDLQERGAALAAMSAQGLQFIEMIQDDPAILSRVGAIPRAFESLSSELQAIGDLFGITKRELDSYDFKGFSAQSTAFKSLMLDFAVTYAATQGQTNRSLSDKDFERFLTIVGSDIRNPDAFVANMMRKSQRSFNLIHQRLQGFNYESAFGPFARFNPDPEQRRAAERKALIEQYPTLIFDDSDFPTEDEERESVEFDVER